MPRGLRILVDGYWWISGPPSNRHVLRETVLRWVIEYPQDRLVVMVPAKDARAARLELPDSVGLIESHSWPHGLSNITELTAAALRWRPDVVYSQNFAVPVGPSLKVAFVHDVLWATNPEWFTRSELTYFSLMTPLARRADLVLTSSRTEATRIREVTGASQVEAVGIGMSSELRAAEPVEPAGMPARFLLTVGRLNIRKNLAGVIDAALAGGVLTPDFPLLIVGAADGKGETLNGQASSAIRDGRVQFTGHVSDGELVWLYKNTDLFIFLSRGEGYGMPPVEAMFFGAPILVSDIDVFQEILPGTVPRFSPDDVAGAGRMIGKIVRQEVSTTPLDQIPEWSETVRRTRAAIIDHMREG